MVVVVLFFVVVIVLVWVHVFLCARKDSKESQVVYSEFVLDLQKPGYV